jgi:hypothetical protein
LLLQNALTERIILVGIFQIWPIIYDSFFAYKLLKRAKNRSTATLSCFFIFNALTFFLALISIILANTPFAYICYLIAFFTLIFAQSFIVIFSWLMVNLDEKISYKKYYLGILIYGIISTYVFWIGMFFEGIRYDSGTDWIPIFSWFFFLISCSYVTIFLIVPEIILAMKLINIFEGVLLKRRIKLFIFSVFLEFAVVLLIVLYNTWKNNIVFKVIYFFLVPPLGMLAVYFIYKSFGKELE